MRLLITTPAEIVIDRADVVSVRAEDETGGFGILDDHADFLTALAVSVVTWRSGDGAEHYCAVRHGVLTVTGGTNVSIATREAYAGEELAALEGETLARMREAADAERTARSGALRLEMKAIRQIVRELGPAEGGL